MDKKRKQLPKADKQATADAKLRQSLDAVLTVCEALGVSVDQVRAYCDALDMAEYAREIAEDPGSGLPDYTTLEAVEEYRDAVVDESREFAVDHYEPVIELIERFKL